MAKKAYVGVNGVARKIKKGYIGVENFTKRTLPSGYTHVEYIQSSGTQYIDTGFKPNQNTRVVMDCQALSADAGGSFPFGVRASLSSKAFAVALVPTQVFYNFATTYQFADYANPLERMVIDANKNIATFTGTTAITITLNSGSFTCDSNLLLATASAAGTPYSGVTAWNGRIFWCKVYDNGTLIRDYVPCTNASGVAGLYDVVNGVFYANAGTGAFTAGAAHGSVARKIKKAYVGVGGVARPFWSGGELTYYGTVTSMSKAFADPGTVNVGDYLLVGGFYSTTADKNYKTIDAYNKSLTKTTTQASVSFGSNIATASVDNKYALIGGGTNSTGDYTIINAFDSSLTLTVPSALGSYGSSQAGVSMPNHGLIGGGAYNSNTQIATVTAYDTSLTKTTPTALSKARYGMTTARAGEYGLFFGGFATGSGETKIVDAYNKSLTRTIATEMSKKMEASAATSVGEYALVGGGASVMMSQDADVNAYNSSLTRSIPTSLSQGRTSLAATRLDGFALFGGGYCGTTRPSEVVDVYDESLTKTVAEPLETPRFNLNAGSIGSYALFVGGYSYETNASFSTVEAYTV